MDDICYDKTGEIDNINIPDEFIEITGLMRLRKKKMKGNLAKIVHKEYEDANEELAEIMEYALMSGRNYYHSFFAEILGETCGISEGKRRFLGAIFEMMYNYFEMQNNIPDIEDVEIRNNKMTCQKKYGISKTIIASNAILSLIYQLLSSNGEIKFSPKIRCELIAILTKYLGKDGLTGGQMLKIISKNKKLYEDEQARMHRLKLSSIYLACADSISLLSECNEKQKNSIKSYVNNFCNLLEIYNKIKTQTNDETKIEGLLKRMEIVKKQSIKSAKNIGENNKKLIDFINYNCYTIERVAKSIIDEKNKISTISQEEQTTIANR